MKIGTCVNFSEIDGMEKNSPSFGNITSIPVSWFLGILPPGRTKMQTP